METVDNTVKPKRQIARQVNVGLDELEDFQLRQVQRRLGTRTPAATVRAAIKVLDRALADPAPVHQV